MKVVVVLLLLLYLFLVGTTTIMAHDEWTGEGIHVAILDSGITTRTHRLAHLIEARNWIGPRSSSSQADDQVGHGVSVAGIINSIHPDCPGHASGVKISMHRVFRTSRETDNAQSIVDALRYLYELPFPVDILNLSYGEIPISNEFEQMVTFWLEKLVVVRGTVIVAAAGNRDRHLFPSTLPFVISVGAMTQDQRILKGSARGWSPYRSMKPDVVAPGHQVRLLSHQSTFAGGHCIVQYGGTSFAAPWVVAHIARLLQAAPLVLERSLNPGEVRGFVLSSTSHLPGVTFHEQGAGLFEPDEAFHKFKTFYPNTAWIFPDKIDVRDHYFKPLTDTPFPWSFHLTLIHPRSATNTYVTDWKWIEKESIDPFFEIQPAESPVSFPLFLTWNVYGGLLPIHISQRHPTRVATLVTGVLILGINDHVFINLSVSLITQPFFADPIIIQRWHA